MAHQIDHRSIRCWVKSKLQSALILQCFLELSPQSPLNQLNKSSGQRKLKKNTQVTSKIISSTHDVKQQSQFVYFSHLLIFKYIKLIAFNSQVISTCELVNRNVKYIIFSSQTNDFYQDALQMCVKDSTSKFLFQSLFDKAGIFFVFSTSFKMFFQIQTRIS